MPAISFKPIRIPEYRIRNNETLAQALQDEAARFAADLKKDFEATVTTWKVKPKFTVALQVSGNTATYWVYTNSKQYLYVSGGAKKHKIFPKFKKALKLAVLKNVNLQLVSWKTVKAIKVPVTRTKVVQVRVFTTLSRHPGIKKRDYPAQIMRKRKPTFSPRMHAAIDKALGKR